VERSLSMELVRVTEAAALSSARWMGKGLKEEADDAATTAMREVFDTIPMKGVVVIGEGEMDEAPMLYIGEKVGNGYGSRLDVAVDPLEGTSIVATGTWGALAVLAVADAGDLLHAPDMYMDKIAVGPEAAGLISLDNSIEENIAIVAKAKNKNVEDVVVTILHRDRHEEMIQRVRATGARIKLIPDGEKCLGGDFQGRLLPEDEAQEKRCQDMGIADTGRILLLDDLVKGEDCIFAATGVTDGELLRGVQFTGQGGQTHSVVMRAKSGTVRFVEGIHSLKKKPKMVMKP